MNAKRYIMLTQCTFSSTFFFFLYIFLFEIPFCCSEFSGAIFRIVVGRRFILFYFFYVAHQWHWWIEKTESEKLKMSLGLMLGRWKKNPPLHSIYKVAFTLLFYKWNYRNLIRKNDEEFTPSAIQLYIRDDSNRSMINNVKRIRTLCI